MRIEAPSAPEWVASCNCSICRRTGALVAYYPPAKVRVDLPEDVRSALAERMGINARLLDGFELREGPHGPVPFLRGAELEVRFFDNAD